MAATLNITHYLTPEGYVIEGSVGEGSDIPSDIFIYETVDGQPSSFFAVCSLSDYQRFPTWEGATLPTFGNKYVKKVQARRGVPSLAEVTAVTEAWTASAKAFRAAYLSLTAPQTTIIAL